VSLLLPRGRNLVRRRKDYQYASDSGCLLVVSLIFALVSLWLARSMQGSCLCSISTTTGKLPCTSKHRQHLASSRLNTAGNIFAHPRMPHHGCDQRRPRTLRSLHRIAVISQHCLPPMVVLKTRRSTSPTTLQATGACARQTRIGSGAPAGFDTGCLPRSRTP
jgi:hypothetical protein